MAHLNVHRICVHIIKNVRIGDTMDSVKIAFGTSEDFRKLQDTEPDSDNNSDNLEQDVENPEQG